MKRDIVTAVIGMIVFTILLGFVYPLFITGVSQLAFPGNANGQKVYVHGVWWARRSSVRASSRP